MTAVVPISTDALKGKNLTEVLKNLTEQKVEEAPQKARKPAKVVQVTPAAKEAISVLNRLLEYTELPSERRLLDEHEQAALLALGFASKTVKKAVALSESAVKEAVFNHLDVRIEDNADETEEIPWDEKNGHYLVKGELSVEGSGKKFVRQIAEGEPTVTAEGLKQLWDEGKISRATYYRITRKPEVPRVVNEEALLDELKAHPELLGVVGEIVEPGKLTASFWIRDESEGDE